MEQDLEKLVAQYGSYLKNANDIMTEHKNKKDKAKENCAKGIRNIWLIVTKDLKEILDKNKHVTQTKRNKF